MRAEISRAAARLGRAFGRRQAAAPGVRPDVPEPRWARTIAVWLLVFVSLYIVGLFLPEGYNWRLDFSRGIYPAWWVPWAKPLIRFLNLPAVFSLTITALALRAYRYRPALLPILLAVLSLPTLWVFFLGEVAGLPLVGLLCLPWAVPLVLLKPQIAAFALLSRRRSFLAACLWLAFSILVWGLWPLQLLVVQSPEWQAMHPQDITLFPWGLLIALPLLWLSRGDEDLLMAAGVNLPIPQTTLSICRLTRLSWLRIAALDP